MGKFVIKQTETGYVFHLKADNGELIATSQVYSSLAGCSNGCAGVAKNVPGAALEDQTTAGFAAEKHPKFEVYADKAGEFRFRLKAANGEIIAVSEGYKTKASCLDGVAAVRKNAHPASVITEK